MRKFFIVVGGLGFLCGCAALDSAVGIRPDGSVDPSGGPLGSGANLLGSFIPWAGAALGAVGTLYSQIRRKKYSDALKSTVNGVSALRSLRSENGTINLTDEKLVKILRDIQEADKTNKLISRVIKKNGSKK
jgi:hypothetical protein|tara:strand:- start:726 stop:1121 length:396 start_codon:yes stop_codon:yes gene_type:complete